MHESQLSQPGTQGRIERVIDLHERLFDPEPVQVHLARGVPPW